MKRATNTARYQRRPDARRTANKRHASTAAALMEAFAARCDSSQVVSRIGPFSIPSCVPRASCLKSLPGWSPAPIAPLKRQASAETPAKSQAPLMAKAMTTMRYEVPRGFKNATSVLSIRRANVRPRDTCNTQLPISKIPVIIHMGASIGGVTARRQSYAGFQEFSALHGNLLLFHYHDAVDLDARNNGRDYAVPVIPFQEKIVRGQRHPGRLFRRLDMDRERPDG